MSVAVKQMDGCCRIPGKFRGMLKHEIAFVDGEIAQKISEAIEESSR